MHHKHHHMPADDLRVPMYSRASTAGLAVASGLSLVAMIATVLLLAF